MENTVVDLFQLNENSDMTVGSTNNKPPYVSFIKIDGKPILPPLISEERRKEMQKYKQKAIEKELKLAKLKKNATKNNQIQSSVYHVNIPPSHAFTPARPATLSLQKGSGNAFVISKSKTEGSLNKFANNYPLDEEIISSHRSAKNVGKFQSSIEQILACEESFNIRNKLNKYQQSPIIEEQIPEKFIDSDNDASNERKRWSPLKIDSINSMKVELPSKDTQETDDNVDMSLDESQNTPETLIQSPSLLRQNSYTLLTPSPALLHFLECQKSSEGSQRTQSRRKTWDLSNAKKNWDPNGQLVKSSDEEDSNDELDVLNKKNSSSLDSLSGLNPEGQEPSMTNSLAYDGGTSPDSFSSKLSFPKTGRMKSKTKGKKSRSLKSVPLPKPVEKVPSVGDTPQELKSPGVQYDLSDLANLLVKIKMDHERQKKELEVKQQSEIKKLEIIFQKKEAEMLSKNQKRKCAKSIYSQSSREAGPEEADVMMMGDGYHHQEKPASVKSYIPNRSRRPHSAKDFNQSYPYDDCNRRTKSMDFNQGNQDTDVDISFMDDMEQSRDTLNIGYGLESDSISNISSHSSTFSSDNRHDSATVSSFKKYQEMYSKEFAKYNQAAMIITAAARGYLTRRLLRTAHVQGLITTLRDAITCATQLHAASDLSDSDIDLMRRLGRQIEAAWDAVYSVFFNMDTTTRLQLIATDRERLRAANTKTPASATNKKRISSATKKSLDRKKGGSLMSKSQTTNGFNRAKTCTKMAASYPSPYFPEKLK